MQFAFKAGLQQLCESPKDLSNVDATTATDGPSSPGQLNRVDPIREYCLELRWQGSAAHEMAIWTGGETGGDGAGVVVQSLLLACRFIHGMRIRESMCGFCQLYKLLGGWEEQWVTLHGFVPGTIFQLGRGSLG